MSGSSAVIQLVISILAITLSVISVVISIRAHRRSARYQDFEFMPRLDLTNEDVRMASQSFPTAFHYRAELVNRGLKPVDVARVIMDCGSEGEAGKREHHVLYGRFTLPPGEKREISFEFRWKDIEDLRRKLKLSECKFFLRVRYEPPSGGVSEVQRSLGGVSGETLGFVAPGGERLK
jgi:hypothetical protein